MAETARTKRDLAPTFFAKLRQEELRPSGHVAPFPQPLHRFLHGMSEKLENELPETVPFKASGRQDDAAFQDVFNLASVKPMNN